MPKAGTEYQELVALVAKAFDPNADVKTGQWIEGPDGNREVDVEVRGTVDGKKHFVLIECKDWKRPVDVQAIDALDSKRQDISADAAIIYSNSGFTKTALRKAERVGIDAASALAEGNKLVRCKIEREIIAKALSVDSWNIRVRPSPESDHLFREQWDTMSLRYEGLSVVNWLTKLSNDLMREYEGKRKVIYTAAFKSAAPFTLGDVPVLLTGLCVEMTCSRKWVSQTVREDVSLGSYNHITHRLLIPSQQYSRTGEFRQDAWEEMDIDGEPEEWSKPLEPNSYRLAFTLLNPIHPIEGESVPLIDDLIDEHYIEAED